MDISKQVCSLKLARKLKALGIKQDSLWWWMLPKWAKGDIRAGMVVSAIKHQRGDFVPDYYSAYTSAELGEMLPLDISTYKVDNDGYYGCCQQDSEDGDTIWYEVYQDNTLFEPQGFYADTEADARAKMVIFLLEHEKTRELILGNDNH